MAQVALTLKLMPASSDVDLAGIEAKVKKLTKVRSISREPVAFGLEALRIVAVVEDAAGASDELERALIDIPGVGSVQVVGLTRIL